MYPPVNRMSKLENRTVSEIGVSEPGWDAFAKAYRRQGTTDEALRELIDKDADEGAYQIGEAQATREVDSAFEWLDRAHAQRDGGLSGMKTSPFLHSLHGDPRWGAFLRKMGLGG